MGCGDNHAYSVSKFSVFLRICDRYRALQACRGTRSILNAKLDREPSPSSHGECRRGYGDMDARFRIDINCDHWLHCYNLVDHPNVINRLQLLQIPIGSPRALFVTWNLQKVTSTCRVLRWLRGVILTIRRSRIQSLFLSC